MAINCCCVPDARGMLLHVAAGGQRRLRTSQSNLRTPRDAGGQRDEELTAAFTDLANNRPVTPASVKVQMGRTLHIERAGQLPQTPAAS